MPDVGVNGARLHYEEEGAGEPLLLLHGGLGTAQLHWWREIPYFARRFRVIAPDMRGYGRSTPPREFPPDFYHQDGADMAALLRAVGHGPAHVIGWSDGAIVALVLAVRHPDLVRTLVSVSGEARLHPHERAGWPALVDTSRWSEGALRRFVETQGPLNWPGIFQKMLDGYESVFTVHGGEVISARVHEIACPTLILHGEADPVVPVEQAYALHAAIAGSTLHIYAGAGHQPYREHEEDFRARVLDFLTAHGARPHATEPAG
jgi:valacyclovir hydrolase